MRKELNHFFIISPLTLNDIYFTFVKFMDSIAKKKKRINCHKILNKKSKKGKKVKVFESRFKKCKKIVYEGFLDLRS
ncbi:hypothetical protein B9T66_01530 [Helicobacter sp. TUL]|nr:hypothetical protein B9T66_01530 [Helicobacter sp. TUL]